MSAANTLPVMIARTLQTVFITALTMARQEVLLTMKQAVVNHTLPTGWSAGLSDSCLGIVVHYLRDNYSGLPIITPGHESVGGLTGLAFTVNVWEFDQHLETGNLTGVTGDIALLEVASDGTYTVLAVCVLCLDTGNFIGYYPDSPRVIVTSVHGLQNVCPGPPANRLEGVFVVMDNARRFGGEAGRVLDNSGRKDRPGLADDVTSPSGSLTRAVWDLLFGQAYAVVLPPTSTVPVWRHAPFAGLMGQLGLTACCFDKRKVIPDCEKLRLNGQDRPLPVVYFPAALLGRLIKFLSEITLPD